MIEAIVSIVVSVIGTIGTITAVVISNSATKSGIEAELDKHNAVQDERIANLTEEVRKHNNFAVQIPRLEERIANLEKRIDRIMKNE